MQSYLSVVLLPRACILSHPFGYSDFTCTEPSFLTVCRSEARAAQGAVQEIR